MKMRHVIHEGELDLLFCARYSVDRTSQSGKTSHMNLKPLLLPFFAFAFGSLASAQSFITFGPNVKVVFTQVVESGFTVTKATASVSETAPDGTITVRRQSEVIVPDGIGGFTQRVTQEETVASPDPGNPGVFSVTTSTEVLTTPLDETQTPSAATTTSTTVVTDPTVNAADLDLPPVTTFVPLDENLDEPVVISPA